MLSQCWARLHNIETMLGQHHTFFLRGNRQPLETDTPGSLLQEGQTRCSIVRPLSGRRPRWIRGPEQRTFARVDIRALQS